MTEKSNVTQAPGSGRRLMTEAESKDLLLKAGIPAAETRLAATGAEAAALARKMGFPVVLKIASRDIVHKSDAGGVVMGLESPDAVEKAFSEGVARAGRQFPEADILGMTVQPQARPGVEVIIGMSKDPQFGPVLMFGLGGVWVEIMKDVSFRITPITRRDAVEMIEEIKGYPLLTGYRGAEPVSIDALVDILLKVSELVEANPAIEELDLNPVIAYSESALAVDARIVLKKTR